VSGAPAPEAEPLASADALDRINELERTIADVHREVSGLQRQLGNGKLGSPVEELRPLDQPPFREVPAESVGLDHDLQPSSDGDGQAPLHEAASPELAQILSQLVDEVVSLREQLATPSLEQDDVNAAGEASYGSLPWAQSLPLVDPPEVMMRESQKDLYTLGKGFDTKKFDPNRHREWLRGIIALALVGALGLMLWRSFVIVGGPGDMGLKDLLATTFAPVVALVGAATGFYYGERARSNETSSSGGGEA
jgi:hypothetical protein